MSHSPSQESLGSRLRRARLGAPMTLEELANRSGISVRAISDLERGRTLKPYPRTVRLLIAALDLPAASDIDPVRLASHPDRSGASRPLQPTLGPAPVASVPLSAPVQDRAGREDEHEALSPQGEGVAAGHGLAARGVASTARAKPDSAPARPLEYPGRVIPASCPRRASLSAGASELATLTGLLNEVGAHAPGTVVISAIGGTAGIGKTALALHWAHQAAPRFGDGQLYVNLRGFIQTDAPASPSEAIRGFLDALAILGR
jgi:transcriptional regulator with XRE-family HTH domain